MLANVLSGGTFVQTVFDGVMGLATAGMVGGATPFFVNLRDQASFLPGRFGSGLGLTLTLIDSHPN